MYESSFGLTEAPFSISPDPRYLYLSRQHQEAMAHLRYGIRESGGFVQLTGEVGTGKTTICRCTLEQLPEKVDVALILNPQISHNELLAALCDEIGVSYPEDASPKQLLDLLTAKLIETFSEGRRTVLVIDEAQMLTRVVLEQIRILTNLETTRQKLLQIILIGQPELSNTLSRRDLRQLAQRITARYHLEPLGRNETAEYIKYRLGVAGCHRAVFTRSATRRVYKLSAGVPRLINVICDRALLGAYSRNSDIVNASTVSSAAREVFGGPSLNLRRVWPWVSGLAAASVLAAAVLQPQWFTIPGLDPEPPPPLAEPVGVQPDAESSQAPAPLPDTAEAGASESPPSAPATAEAAEPDSADSAPDATGAAETESPAPEISPAQFLDSGNFADSEREALSRLLSAWRVSVAESDALSCSIIEEIHGLRCLRASGTWQDLQSFNRVAALKLRHGGTDRYVLLTGMAADRVSVAGPEEVGNFTRADLQPYWEGEYLLLWRAPPKGAELISQNSEGVDVLWLRQTLSRVPSLLPLELDKTYYDSSLREKIKTFQKSNDLTVDGIAGARTIIRLNTVVDPDVPKLEPASG